MPARCSACQGHGQIQVQKLEQRHNPADPSNPFVETVVVVEDCKACAGRGELMSGEDLDRSEVEWEENYRNRASLIDEDE